MLLYILGDLLEQENGYLCQQCNCVTVKSRGLSQSFIDRFGQQADMYGQRCGYDTPSTIKVIDLDSKQNVKMVCMLSQVFPSSHKQEKRWKSIYKYNVSDSENSRIKYFKKCLDLMKTELQGDVYFPHNIGCGLAGGNWNTYKQCIKDFAENFPYNVYIVMYKK